MIIWIRAVFNGFSISSLKEKLYYYRFHEGSLTDKKRKEISAALYKLLVYHFQKFKNNDKTIYISAKLYLRLSSLALANEDYKAAKFYMLKAIKRKPLFILDRQFYKLIYRLIV